MAEVVVKNAKVADVNQVKLTGHMIARKETARCMVVYFRSTTTHGKRKYTNSMTLLVFDKELNAKINAIPLRTPVSVEGYVTSNRKKEDVISGRKTEQPAPETDSKDKAKKVSTKREKADNAAQAEEQYIVLTDVKLAEKGATDSNEVTLIGSVFRAYVAKNGKINFIISTVREGHYLKLIKASVFPREGVDYLSCMASGARVKLTGHISTFSIDSDEGTKYNESIVIDNIEKA